ncbi:MAG: amidohydrolase family protein [Myxococcota bacterium]
MLIANAEVDGVTGLDVRVDGATITEIGPALAVAAGEARLDARGGALLPGLHDHHIHLFALAAADRSLRCGPPRVCDAASLANALSRRDAGTGWLRGVGYHESVAGELDRESLDNLVPDRPLRIQHRSGALWMVNSAAAALLGLDDGAEHSGIERDAGGRATGRLFRMDDWLRERIGGEPPRLTDVSRRLARFGVTGLTDATATNGAAEAVAFRRAIDAGDLLQRIVMMGTLALPGDAGPRLARGAVKLLIDERDLPGFDDLRSRFEAIHRAGRTIAIHCVTRVELVLTLAALAASGTRSGDRIEHAGVAPPDVLPLLAKQGLTVVSQPHFIRERGDAYRESVDARDLPWLYRARALLDASVRLGGGSDAPFGSCDPWAAMRTAVARRTQSGALLGGDERLSPEQALALFTSPAADPGGPPRRVAVGSPADLCLLACRWSEARQTLASDLVAATLVRANVVWRRE